MRRTWICKSQCVFSIIQTSMHQFLKDLLEEILKHYILVLNTSLSAQNRKDRKFSFAFSHAAGGRPRSQCRPHTICSAWAPSALR